MDIDIDLYSRSIKTFGVETMVELSKLSILIIGMRGLGVEVAKNISLSGPKTIDIFDPEICSINDMGSNYYINRENIEKKQRRDEASAASLSKLNNYVKIIMNGNDIFRNLKLYNVIIVTEIMETSFLININEECRKNNIAFIYGCSLGLSCFVFSDFGEKFVVKDGNGEEIKTFVIKNITNEQKALVTIDENVGWDNKFDINEDNMIIFSDIKGMDELNDNKPRAFIRKDFKSFLINEDTTNYGKYIKGGYAKQYKPPIVKNYKNFKEKLEIPFDDNNFPQCIDYRKPDNIVIIHLSIIILQEFFSENKKLPNLNDINISEKLALRVEDLYNQYKQKNIEFVDNVDNFDRKICINVFRWAKAEISPICSFLGGIIAQEAIKKTGKYTPIDQWMWFDFFEMISKIPDNIDRTLLNSRYDDQIAIFGNDIQKELGNLNIFMVGAGANGSEFLKNFAMMGISVKNGKTIITDDDIIETSNLNRQFLFRYKHRGKSKSLIACKTIKKFNSEFNVESKEIKVCKETENIFNDEFLQKQNFIIFGVDSIAARKYLDNQCTNLKLIGIDAGTLGPKGRVQLIIPYKTICFNDNPDPEEESIPMCTLHHYPNTIRHCIEWAKIKFIFIFIEIINEIKIFFDEPNKYFDNLCKESTLLVIEKLNLLNEYIIIMKDKTIKSIIRFAIKLYNFFFVDEINKILLDFPKDYKNKDGDLYWSGSKRMPHPIIFNYENEFCRIFISNIIIYLSKIFNFQVDETNIQLLLNEIEIPTFIIHENKNIEELKNIFNDILIKSFQLKEEINKIKKIEFEKEDNIQISIIHSISNLKAANFDIPQSSFINTKLIVGKIIPSIPTSTASVGGIVSLQIFSLIQNLDLNLLSNCFFNLAVSLVTFIEPRKVKHNEDREMDALLGQPVKCIPKGWTIWDHIEINNIKTLQELINKVKNEYKVDISIITSNEIIIYQSFSKKDKNKLNEKIIDIYDFCNKNKNNIIKPYLWLDIVGKQNNIIVLMPKIKYFY